MINPHTVEFCEKCTNRGFSPKSGIICSLTEAPADFGASCPKFDEDDKEAERIAKIRKDSARSLVINDSMGLSFIGIPNPIVAGVIIVLASVIWFFVGLLYFDVIFYYPPLGLIFGFVAIFNGISKRKKAVQKRDHNESILDDF